MGNILSKLTSFINDYPTIENELQKKLLLLSKEYLATLNRYNHLTTGPIYNTIHKFEDELFKSLNDIIEYNEADDEPRDKEREEELQKTFVNKLIEQLSKIQKQELIEEGVEIMIKQIVINREQATRLLVENGYDPVSAILAHMNHKSKEDDKTYFTFQLNQHELVNELVTMSDKLTGTNHTLTNFTSATLNKVRSYVCILIKTENDLHKVKKYSSIAELYHNFISTEINTLNIISFDINNESFGLLIDKNSITTTPQTTTSPVNNPLTVTLRNMNIIKKEEFYCGLALFINNCFLN